jgi:hypothetical protein
MLSADESAVLELVCVPATFTPAWVAYAEESADWVVSADWSADCACPEPPHPASQRLLLDWVWSGSWVVDASLDASDEAELSSDWYPPALVPVWSALASDVASWSVDASWDASWAWPELPQPAAQLLLLDWSCDAL